MIYKVSYVVVDGKFPGSIKNETERPQVGQLVQIGKRMFEVVSVTEVMPPRDEFLYLHASVQEAQSTAPV